MPYLDNPKSSPAYHSLGHEGYHFLSALSCSTAGSTFLQWDSIWDWEVPPWKFPRPVSYSRFTFMPLHSTMEFQGFQVGGHREPTVLLAFWVSSGPPPFLILKNRRKFQSAVTTLWHKADAYWITAAVENNECFMWRQVWGTSLRYSNFSWWDKITDFIPSENCSALY